MAASLQQTTIFGNVGGDAETKQVAGKTVHNFNVAVNKDRKMPDGEWKKRVYWWRVECWGDRLPANIRKGAQVVVSGDMELVFDKEDKLMVNKTTGMPLLKIRTSANQICVARSGQAGGADDYAPMGSNSSAPSDSGEDAPMASPTSNALDDELPF
jgi:single stranded DNA-binding protein